MTFSAEELVVLLDEVMMSGDWHSIRIFNGGALSGAQATPGVLVSMGRDHTSFTVDQLVPEARPSEKLWWLLNHNARGRQALPQTENQPSGDIDRMQTLLDDI